MTVENKLAERAKQPGAFISAAKHEFLIDMRKAATSGVGYGWMQQVIEWEWQSTGPGAHGPEHFGARIQELEEEIEDMHKDAAGASI